MTLLERIQNQEILQGSSLFNEIHEIKEEKNKIISILNGGYHSSQEIRQLLSSLTESTVDSSVEVSIPFYSDFGKHITFGNNVFINQNVMFTDLGGITIEDNVLIGPFSRLITVNHIKNPLKRRGLTLSPIHIEKNVWIGANVTILPGVRIGENSIIAADSTVTKSIPKDVIAAGSPARIIKSIYD